MVELVLVREDDQTVGIDEIAPGDRNDQGAFSDSGIEDVRLAYSLHGGFSIHGDEDAAGGRTAELRAHLRDLRSGTKLCQVTGD